LGPKIKAKVCGEKPSRLTENIARGGGYNRDGKTTKRKPNSLGGGGGSSSLGTNMGKEDYMLKWSDLQIALAGLKGGRRRDRKRVAGKFDWGPLKKEHKREDSCEVQREVN